MHLFGLCSGGRRPVDEPCGSHSGSRGDSDPGDEKRGGGVG